jgi:glutathione S-transferase
MHQKFGPTIPTGYLYAYTAPKTADGKPDREVIEAVMPELREQIGVLDRAVAKNGYLDDEQFTFADINLLPILYRVSQAPEGAETLATATHLASYYDQHTVRPSFKSTIPPPAHRAGKRRVRSAPNPRGGLGVAAVLVARAS